MAHLSPLSFWCTLFLLSSVDFGQSSEVTALLGNPVAFAKANCSTGRLVRVEARGDYRPVVERSRGVCTPAGDYKDRVDPDGCFAFRRSVFTDSGLFELTCGNHTENIQLYVAVAFNASVSEGEPVRLECHIIPHAYMEVIRWERNGTKVLQFYLPAKKTEYGTGFEGRVRLEPDCQANGDWSLIWDRALLEDQGDYFCAAYNKGARKEWGRPAAGRLKVRPVQTSPGPPWVTVGICFGVGLCVACLVVGWYLKKRRRVQRAL